MQHEANVNKSNDLPDELKRNSTLSTKKKRSKSQSSKKKSDVTEFQTNELIQPVRRKRDQLSATVIRTNQSDRFRIVLLHSKEDQYLNLFNTMIHPLRKHIDSIVTFVDSNDLMKFLTNICDEQILFFSGIEQILPLIGDIHPLKQIDTIYLLNETNQIQRRQLKKWLKIRDSSKIDRFISETFGEKALLKSVRSSLSSIQQNDRVILLPASFILTQLLTEMVSPINDDDDEKTKKEFFNYARQRYQTDRLRLSILEHFEKSHSSEDPICWYSKYNLIFKDVNDALWSERIREILMMRFFIRSLFRRMKQLHRPVQHCTNFFRGQYLSNTDFEQLRLRTGSFYPFNCFLSASRSRQMQKFFSTTDYRSEDSTQVAVIFQIHIEPEASQWLIFAPVDGEDEILFSTSSLFRVGRIDQLEENVWHVNLFSSNDQEIKLQSFIQSIRIATEGSTEWEHIGTTLFNLKFIHTSREFLNFMIENSEKQHPFSPPHHQHLIANREQIFSNYSGARTLLLKVLDQYQRDPKVTDQTLINIHRDIGWTSHQLRQYQEAEQFFRQALKIQEKMDPTNYIALLSLYQLLVDTLEASSSHSYRLKINEKFVDIRQKKIFEKSFEIAEIYRNIAKCHYCLEQYESCLIILTKLDNLQQSFMQETDPRYVHLQSLMEDLQERISVRPPISKAMRQVLQFQDNQLKLLHSRRTVDSTDLAQCYNLLGESYFKVRDYPMALKWYQAMLRCMEKDISTHAEHSAAIYDRVGQIHEKMKNDLQALHSYRKAIEIELKSSNDDDSSLQLYREHLQRLGKLPVFFNERFYQKSAR